MKATGIVRRIDELGRIVIPKEIRKKLKIREADPMEIYTENEGEVILKKYSPMGDEILAAKNMCRSIANATGNIVFISDREKIIAAGGKKSGIYENRDISQELINIMENRETVCAAVGEDEYIEIFEDKDAGNYCTCEVISPIISEGDVMGCIVMLSFEERKKFNDTEKTMAKTVADFLGMQMEG